MLYLFYFCWCQTLQAYVWEKVVPVGGKKFFPPPSFPFRPSVRPSVGKKEISSPQFSYIRSYSCSPRFPRCCCPFILFSQRPLISFSLYKGEKSLSRANRKENVFSPPPPLSVRPPEKFSPFQQGGDHSWARTPRILRAGGGAST